MNKLLTVSLLASAFVVGTAFAGNSAQVGFIAGQTNGSFHCKTKDTIGGETVNIDTHLVNAEGFCSGQYVTSKGHIAGLPVTTLDTSFFQIQKQIYQGGYVTVTLNGVGSIECKSGDGNDRTLFGANGGYCLSTAAQ